MQSTEVGQVFETSILVAIDGNNAIETVNAYETPEEVITRCFFVNRRTTFQVANMIQTWQPIVFAPGGTTHMTSEAKREIASERKIEVIRTIKFNGKAWKEVR